MAIEVKQNESLASKDIEGVKTKKIINEQQAAYTKKKGFLASTIEELKKVEWPSFIYVVKWSLVIVIFTAFFAISLGFFDNAFESTLEFVDCSARISRSEASNSDKRDQLGECGSTFFAQVSLQE